MKFESKSDDAFFGHSLKFNIWFKFTCQVIVYLVSLERYFFLNDYDKDLRICHDFRGYLPIFYGTKYCITPNIRAQEIFANFARGRGKGAVGRHWQL